MRLQWFFKLRWSRYALAVGMLTGVSLLSTIPPKMIGNTIDQIRVGNLTPTGLSHTVLLLVCLALLLYVMAFVWITNLFGNSALVEKLLRGRLVSHLTRM